MDTYVEITVNDLSVKTNFRKRVRLNPHSSGNAA